MDKIYDLLIIGGGSAGLSAGIYAGRAKLNTLIIEKDKIGGQTITTSELVNYPGIRTTTGPKLMDDMRLHALDFGVEFTAGDIEKVDFSGDIKLLYTNQGVYMGHSVIIATGAVPCTLGFPGESEFTGRGIGYCSTCDGEFFEGLDIFVVGAGFAAAEEAIFLTRFAKKVTVIAREPEFTCAKTIADKVLSHPKIEVKFNTEVVEAKGDDMLTSAKFINNVTGETFEYHASKEDQTFGLFIFVGYSPATEVFKDHVEIDSHGYIPTKETMETNIPGVYAAGDLRPKSLRQIVTAVADGAIAATDAEKHVAAQKERLGIKETYSENQRKPQIPQESPTSNVEHSSSNDFLNADIKNQLKTIFAKLDKEVTLVSIVDPKDPKSVELRDFILSISQLSDKILTQIYNKDERPDIETLVNADKLPVVSLLNTNKDYSGVKFHGIPGGHELNSFVLAIYNLGGPGQAIDPNIASKVQAIDKPINLKVCISLSCQLCPDVVVAAQRIAMLNPNIETEMIDISLFPDIRKEYKIMSVPAIIVNDDKIYFGAKKIDEILELI
ncbi:MAG TPA: FAD-dependent oxidoreductase [Epulopiscium sp.]|nr:FAD-dependent oxidoreductase [Candidatus Epulonipiscium sp.]